MGRLFPLVAVTFLATACDDLRDFAGTWQGSIVSDPVLQKGFAADSRLDAVITSATRHDVDLALGLPGQDARVRFSPIERASADALGSLRLDDDPLRTYLGFVRPPGQEAYLVVVSLYPHEQIDVRLIRGPDDAYGVFALTRARP
jgi:hypothetical protein